MRRLLLATTSLAAAGLFGSQADAADRLKLGVGGYFNAFLVGVSQDDGPGEAAAGRANHKIAEEAEIHFSGETVLDNGLEIGIQVELEAESCTDQMDDSYIWFEGGFGRLQVGAADPVSDAMYYGAPEPIAGVGLSTPDDVFSTLSNSVATPATITNISGNAEKFSYFTPRIAGIQLGLSYTPNNCKEGTIAGACGGSYAGMPAQAAGDQTKITELAANYTGELAGTDVALYGAYGRGELEGPAPGSRDQVQWGLGAEVGYAGFTVGAAYRNDNQGTSGANTDRRDWAVGVSYGLDDWTLGVEYVDSTAEEGAGLGEDETTGWQFGGTYALGPGVTLTGGITTWKVRDNLHDPASENDSVELIAGTIIEL
ncbi:MAG TPA: porin [Alphaproteobacteria bacterium]|nr:porin [Alphaproteobacteria bacterium]